eukprot:COSAG02_NODE_5412_length_4349_cov_8.741176_2_plen_156_part_00
MYDSDDDETSISSSIENYWSRQPALIANRTTFLQYIRSISESDGSHPRLIPHKHVQAICSKLLSLVTGGELPLGRRQLYVNCGAAIAATHAPALRTGETCPGDSWNPVDYWSRATIAAMLDADQLARPDVDSVLIKAMTRKTVYMSPVARDIVLV